MGLQKQFAEFNDKIRLTWKDDKLKKIREKDESIQVDIRTAFKEAGHPVVEFFQQGSYATQTCIEPINDGDDYDIDVGIVIDKENAPDDPVEAKKTLRDVLAARNLKDPKIKKPCVTAQYYKADEKNFHLDYPLYSKNASGAYSLAIGKEYASAEEKKWEPGDPKGLIDWVNDKSRFNNDDDLFAQYKRLIRYLKRWRDFSFSSSDRKNIYSIGLSVMIRQSFQGSISTDGDCDDLESLRKTVTSILNNGYFRQTGYDANNKPKYEIVVNLPVEPGRDIFNKHGSTLGTTLYNKFSILKENLNKVKLEKEPKKQCELLADSVF
jgi:predicted nucleotidyltransferase